MNRAAPEAVLIVAFCAGVVWIAWRTTAPVAEPWRYSEPRTYSEKPFDNRYYRAVRDSTRALVRRRYKGDTTTARARAYFRHMDSAYDPTYIPPALGH